MLDILTPSIVGGAADADDALHRRLAAFNHERLTPSLPDGDWRGAIAAQAEWLRLEGDYLEGERAAVRDRAGEAPSEPQAFAAWYEDLRRTGPGQGDALFPWLAEEASLDEMKWFLTQEVAGEAGFEDLTALTQIKLPVRPKLELARNYWDEMGRGNAKGMHGPLLERLADHLGVSPTTETTVWESLALANTMAGLAANRRYAYQSVGALGVIEMTAPERSALVNVGLRRLGVRARDRNYFALHATLDVKHSAAWNAEAIGPLVADDPRVASAIAEGALMRLAAGARCFSRYRREFGLAL